MLLSLVCGGLGMVAGNGHSYTPSLKLVILTAFCLGVIISGEDNDRLQCRAMVEEWASKENLDMYRAGMSNSIPDRNLQELLFFLHIPRTGGRNYNFCFLKNFFPKDNMCPRSYDKLRFDPSIQTCKFLSTHDDYSLLSKLQKEKTSVVTNMRNPVQRVIGVYEFSVEVAARFLKKPRTAIFRNFSMSKPHLTSTLDIWPWKYLVPWMKDDLFQRRDARLFEEFVTPSNVSSVYNVPSHVMPLREFIHHPVVHELLHNGATFQVVGITNNSILPNAAELRRCADLYQELGRDVLAIAKKRLDSMFFVGLTEKHGRSAELFAAKLEKQITQKAYNDQSLQQVELDFDSHDTKLNGSLFSNQKQMSAPTAQQIFPLEHEDTFKRSKETTWAMNSLLSLYENCSSSMREVQAARRNKSLKFVTPVNFSRQTRDSVPEAVLLEILKLNSLDAELYEHAQKLFEKQENLLRRESKALDCSDTHCTNELLNPCLETKSKVVLRWMVDESSEQYIRNYASSFMFSSVFCLLMLSICTVMVGRLRPKALKFFKGPFLVGGKKSLKENTYEFNPHYDRHRRQSRF